MQFNQQLDRKMLRYIAVSFSLLWTVSSFTHMPVITTVTHRITKHKLVMEEKPWFPFTVAKNVVTMDALK